jgi:hypothetical protein
MLVSIKDDAIHNWHDDQNVYVYTADNRCLKLCKVRDLNLFHGDRTIFVEPVDDNYQLCQPQERVLPPNCVGGRECPYPETCYRLETDQQDYECTFPSEEDYATYG